MVVALDFQNLAVSAASVAKLDELLMDELNEVVPECDHELYKAFCGTHQAAAAAELKKRKWRVRTSESDLDSTIIQECKSDCGHNPDDTTLVICSKDRDFAQVVEEMRGWGVDVYVVGTHASSQRLKNIAGSKWLQLPYSPWDRFMQPG